MTSKPDQHASGINGVNGVNGMNGSAKYPTAPLPKENIFLFIPNLIGKLDESVHQPNSISNNH